MHPVWSIAVWEDKMGNDRTVAKGSSEQRWPCPSRTRNTSGDLHIEILGRSKRHRAENPATRTTVLEELIEARYLSCRVQSEGLEVFLPAMLRLGSKRVHDGASALLMRMTMMMLLMMMMLMMMPIIIIILIKMAVVAAERWLGD